MFKVQYPCRLPDSSFRGEGKAKRMKDDKSDPLRPLLAPADAVVDPKKVDKMLLEKLQRSGSLVEIKERVR